MNKWINVKDRLPQKEIDILICDNGFVKFGIYSSYCYGDKFFTTNFGQFLLTDNVTHWMSLPNPPELK